MTATPALHLSYSLTLRDLLGAQLLNTRLQRVFGRYLLFFASMAVGVVLMKAINDVRLQHEALLAFAAVALVVSLIAAGFFAFCIFPGQVLLKQRRLIRGAPRLFRDVTTVLDDRGFRTSVSSSASEVAWGDVLGFRENAGMLLLYLNKEMFCVLPKRGLSTGQLAELEAMLSLNSKRLT